MLAEIWEVSADAREAVFELRADESSYFEASDAVYSAERLLHINLCQANLLPAVPASGSVIAVDLKTMKFSVTKTVESFLASDLTTFHHR